MDLSLVIPVHSDVRIERCVQSIDQAVEVVAVMNNPTKEVSDIVARIGIKSVVIPQQNLGICYNQGMDASNNELVLFMDSDCVFAAGTIEKMYVAKEKNPQALVRGNVAFQENSFQSRITKSAREVTTSNVPYAFIPPLLLDKDVFGRIGDRYRFAEDVGWCVDFEFEIRRRKAGIGLVHLADAPIYHDPITIMDDFRSAFKYGTGKRIRHERTGEQVNFLDVLKDPIIKGYRERGLSTALYLSLWKAVLYSGYYAQALRLYKANR